MTISPCRRRFPGRSGGQRRPFRRGSRSWRPSPGTVRQCRQWGWRGRIGGDPPRPRPAVRLASGGGSGCPVLGRSPGDFGRRHGGNPGPRSAPGTRPRDAPDARCVEPRERSSDRAATMTCWSASERWRTGKARGRQCDGPSVVGCGRHRPMGGRQMRGDGAAETGSGPCPTRAATGIAARCESRATCAAQASPAAVGGGGDEASWRGRSGAAAIGDRTSG